MDNSTISYRDLSETGGYIFSDEQRNVTEENEAHFLDTRRTFEEFLYNRYVITCIVEHIVFVRWKCNI